MGASIRLLLSRCRPGATAADQAWYRKGIVASSNVVVRQVHELVQQPLLLPPICRQVAASQLGRYVVLAPLLPTHFQAPESEL